MNDQLSVEWRVSNWDHQVHAFETFGEVSSEAVCTHTCMTGKLSEATGTERKCLACMLIFGDSLPDAPWRSPLIG